MISKTFWIGISLLFIGIFLLVIGLLTPNDTTEVDWKELGVVTAVKDQLTLDCENVSWVFASVASIEGLMGVKQIEKLASQSNRSLLTNSRKEYYSLIMEFSTSYTQENLSEQQVLDCTPKQDNCDGGSLLDAYQFTKEYGIVDYQVVPYIAQKEICPRDSKQESVFNITGYTMQTGCANLRELIFKQPVAVRINYSNLQNYLTYDLDKDIITTSKYCPQISESENKIFQYVLVTAYDGNTFTIKNSEGVNWGYSGYAKIDATVDNVCNICDEIYFPSQDS